MKKRQKYSVPRESTGMISLTKGRARVIEGKAPKQRRATVSGMGSTGLLFIAPTLFLLFLFVLLPLLGAVYLSFTSWSLIGSPEFVGLTNYFTLSHNAQFWSAVTVTAKFALFMGIPGALFAFIIAVAVNEGRKTSFFSTLLLFPVLFPSVVSVFIWEAMYLGDGVINSALSIDINWLTSSQWALPSLALMMLWTNLGYYSIIALAGVKDIPKEIYDACSLDGANAVKRTWYITFPLMKPILLFIVMIAIADALTLFIQPYLLTQGGPGDATRTLSQLIYQTAFMYTDIGRASAMAVVLLIASLIFSSFQFRFFSTQKEKK